MSRKFKGIGAKPKIKGK